MNFKFWQLAGQEVFPNSLPESCQSCQCKQLYQQNDFKRSLGLGIIVACSLSTFWLLYEGYNWFAVWSPMLLALFIDRGLNLITPLAVICYRCGTVHRGLEKNAILNKFQAFDLEIYDRINYGDTEAKT